MILAHEIPSGSRLYFGKTATRKRKLEAKACEILQKNGFEEIVTPHFAYHAHQLRENEIESARLIRLASPDNTFLTLRADSSLDVVRLITKRLGKSVDYQKWFYAQPIFSYPSTEVYQIGAEWINSNNIAAMLEIMLDIFKAFNICPIIQLSHSDITKSVCENSLALPEWFTPLNVAKISELGLDWLNDMVALENGNVNSAPQPIIKALDELNDVAKKLPNSVLHPLFVSENDYYSGLFFRAIIGNDIVAQGGTYKSESTDCVGFALYIDNILGKTDE
ncbi:MAG: phosphoribosyltransferase regulatory subunit [Pseudomonadota bacterium]